jgi:hypothetical protein
MDRPRTKAERSGTTMKARLKGVEAMKRKTELKETAEKLSEKVPEPRSTGGFLGMGNAKIHLMLATDSDGNLTPQALSLAKAVFPEYFRKRLE